MDILKAAGDIHDVLLALSYSQPRILGMLTVLPAFSPQVLPGMIRLAVGAALGILVIPVMLPVVHEDLGAALLVAVLVKEALVGFALGFVLSVPFWAFEAAGFFIDNQRGASIAATLNPMTGNDSSPLGILFNQAFIVFFLLSGGMFLVVGALYDSFGLWPVVGWVPQLRAESVPMLLGLLDTVMRMAVLYGAPVIVAMFLAELGLALVSRFVPQLQVFFLAMPIKSALALVVLLVYLTSLFDLTADSIQEMRQALPLLDQHWRGDGVCK